MRRRRAIRPRSSALSRQTRLPGICIVYISVNPYFLNSPASVNHHVPLHTTPAVARFAPRRHVYVPYTRSIHQTFLQELNARVFSVRDLFCGLVMLTNIHAGNKLRLILMSHKARVRRTACLNFVLDTAKREASRKSRNVSSVARCLTCGWAQEEHHEADGPLDTPHTARRNRPGQLPTARLPEKPQTGPKGGEDDDADPDEAFWGERRGF